MHPLLKLLRPLRNLRRRNQALGTTLIFLGIGFQRHRATPHRCEFMWEVSRETKYRPSIYPPPARRHGSTCKRNLTFSIISVKERTPIPHPAQPKICHPERPKGTEGLAVAFRTAEGGTPLPSICYSGSAMQIALLRVALFAALMPATLMSVAVAQTPRRPGLGPARLRHPHPGPAARRFPPPHHNHCPSHRPLRRPVRRRLCRRPPAAPAITRQRANTPSPPPATTSGTPATSSASSGRSSPATSPSPPTPASPIPRATTTAKSSSSSARASTTILRKPCSASTAPA